MFRAIHLFLHASVSSVRRYSLFVPPERVGLGKVFFVCLAWGGVRDRSTYSNAFFDALWSFSFFLPVRFVLSFVLTVGRIVFGFDAFADVDHE